MSSKVAATVKKASEVRKSQVKATEPVVTKQLVASSVKGSSATVAPVVEAKVSAPVVEAKVSAPVVEAKVSAPVVLKENKTPSNVVKLADMDLDEAESSSETSPEVNMKGKDSVQPKKKRQRPKIRSFSDIFASIYEDIDMGYKRLQLAHRALKSLESAHNREVHNTKSRESSARTPTIVFDQVIIDYFRQRLNSNELVVRRKDGTEVDKVYVNLSDLSTETRVHRTDVTQLYNLVFKKHNMQDPEDGRFIMYQKDQDLVNLLTTGAYDPKLEDDVEQLRNGTFRLTIFNIQRFTNHHLGCVELQPKVRKDDATVDAAVTA